jgi:dihydroorotate dehydrogenase electron transfer subunit
MAFQNNGLLIRNERIKSSYFLLKILCPRIAETITPGQFIMIRVSKNYSPMLRRPFSVYRSYPPDHPEREERGSLEIIYKVIGKGTRRMADLKKGEEVDLIGPLGNGFSFPPLPSSTGVTLIGGGVGIVSLYSLAERLKSSRLCVYIGGKTEDDIIGEEDFRKLSPSVFVATEDGSRGYTGTVIDLFASRREKTKRSASPHIYSCGPVEMLKALAKLKKFGRSVFQVSLEARMACGFGACWGCVIRTNDPKTPYQRVCKEGPVFNLKDVAWKVL